MHRSRTRLTPLRLVALIVALAMLAAACGDDDDTAATPDDEQPRATTEATAPKPTGEPVKLMVIYEKEAGISNPELPEGALAAAEAINGDGGISGRPVEIIVCDTGNDPNQAAECGRRAVSEKVLALVGNLTPHSGSFLPLMVENKIASVGIVPASAADFLSEAAFPITGGAPVTFGALPVILADQGAKKISIVRPDIAAAAALKIFSNSALKRLNLEVLNDVAIPQGAPDMSTYVAAAMQGGTDGIVVGLSGQDALNFVQAARQAHPDLPIGLISTEPGPVQEALGDDTEKIYQSPAYVPVDVDNEANEEFKNDMKAAGYDDLTGFRRNSYASVMMVARLLEELPEITPAALYEKLATLEGFDLGFIPPLQYTKGGVAGLPRVFNPCEIATTVKDGEVVAVTGKFFDAFSGAECPLG